MKFLRSKKFWRALIPSLIFNFKYLPFNQAKKLPIWVYKMHCLSQKGRIIIDSDHIHTGMIQLGFPRSATFPNTGITWRNKGKVVFKGTCKIPRDSYVIVGKQATLTIGDDFQANSGLKLVSNCRISFGRHTRIGWEVTILDTNFHPLIDMEKNTYKKAFSPIIVGDCNWFGTQCFVMHGVQTPEYCVFGARSIVTRGGKYEPYCVHGGSPIHVLSRNVMYDYEHEQITDYTLP